MTICRHFHNLASSWASFLLLIFFIFATSVNASLIHYLHFWYVGKLIILSGRLTPSCSTRPERSFSSFNDDFNLVIRQAFFFSPAHHNSHHGIATISASCSMDPDSRCQIIGRLSCRCSDSRYWLAAIQEPSIAAKIFNWRFLKLPVAGFHVWSGARKRTKTR